MAMKHCKECGSEISSHAKTCPQCGKEQKNFFQKHIILTFILVLFIIGTTSSMFNSNNSTNTTSTSTYTKNKNVEVTVADFSSMEKSQVEDWCNNNKVNFTIKEDYSDNIEKGKFISQSFKANSTISQGDKIIIAYSLGKEPSIEYKNALLKAETYSKTMHMSKQGIYDQLTSSYGEGFSTDAAQYAIDNLDVDWKANALEKAKSYQTMMSMSKNAIYNQLVSSYGEKFTKEEAQYAIDNLDN